MICVATSYNIVIVDLHTIIIQVDAVQATNKLQQLFDPYSITVSQETLSELLTGPVNLLFVSDYSCMLMYFSVCVYASYIASIKIYNLCVLTLLRHY